MFSGGVSGAVSGGVSGTVSGGVSGDDPDEDLNVLDVTAMIEIRSSRFGISNRIGGIRGRVMAIEQDNFLPCPFCGELPDFLPTTNRVYCFNESCGAGPEMQIASLEDYRAELVTAWNTRSSADVSRLTAEIAELREQLRQRDEMLAAIDGCEIWIGGTKIRKCHDRRWRRELGTWSRNGEPFEYDDPGHETLFEAIKAIEK
jgi:hypothetical protein